MFYPRLVSRKIREIAMQRTLKITESCSTCKKRDTSRCPEKQNGKNPGPHDWCYGYKVKK
jgi:hypothetical protein